MLADDGTLTVCRHEQPALQKVESYIVAEGETWSHPVVSSGHLVIKDTDSLNVWRVKSDTASAVSSRRQTRRVDPRKVRIPNSNISPEMAPQTTPQNQ